MAKTLEARATKESFPKAGELVDVLEVSALTLQDRQLLNELLRHAHEDIDKAEHCIHKSELRSVDKSLARLEASVSRLVSTQLRMNVTRDGETYSRTMSFLTTVDNAAREDGHFYFKLNSDVVTVIKDSNVFARIRRDVMFALSSKFALALYEMLAKRVNLRFKQFEVFELETLRSMLGVSQGKLSTWQHLRDRCLVTAVDQVNELTDIGCAFEPVKTGRAVSHVRLMWWDKDFHAQADARRAREAHSVSRKGKRASDGDTLSEGD